MKVGHASVELTALRAHPGRTLVAISALTFAVVALTIVVMGLRGPGSDAGTGMTNQSVEDAISIQLAENAEAQRQLDQSHLDLLEQLPGVDAKVLRADHERVRAAASVLASSTGGALGNHGEVQERIATRLDLKANSRVLSDFLPLWTRTTQDLDLLAVTRVDITSALTSGADPHLTYTARVTLSPLDAIGDERQSQQVLLRASSTNGGALTDLHLDLLADPHTAPETTKTNG